jgi:hypothetical protein
MRPNIQLLPPEGQAAALEVIKEQFKAGMPSDYAAKIERILAVFMVTYGVETKGETPKTETPSLQMYPHHFIEAGIQLSVTDLPTLVDVQAEFWRINKNIQGVAISRSMISAITDEVRRNLADKIRFHLTNYNQAG